jgi:CRISPR-associated protein Csb2
MSLHLMVTVRLHDVRYHGAGGEPSPARLFQALVAGAGLSGPDSLQKFEDSLKWLERLDDPIVAFPNLTYGHGFKTFVPNNDLDTVAGDVRRIGRLRTIKTIKPCLVKVGTPWLYIWPFEAAESNEKKAVGICELAERLYQFGRGLDMAWAYGEVLDSQQLEMELSSYSGVVCRPSRGIGTRTLACPKPGSLDSLKDRYAANGRRFTAVRIGKTQRRLFSQPTKPHFEQIPYDSPASLRMFELREGTAEALLRPWRLADASRLVVILRDLALDRLRRAFPQRIPQIERVLVGRKADGSNDGPTALRIRIIPLPSIGHQHADLQIRRVLIQVPAACPFRVDDIHWAFSGLELIDPETGDVLNIVLTPATDDSMLKYYGLPDHQPARVWRSVTPVALPDSVRRRRINRARIKEEAKGGTERANEHGRAAAAVVQALRHAEVRIRPDSILLQREPFESNGERVERFAPATRFPKERLWHVKLAFNEPIAGPMVIGDGRFLGLGVMAPVTGTVGIHVFAIEDRLAAQVDPIEISRALRRAVMARVQETFGSRKLLPPFFSGHERDGSSAQTQRHPHLAFVFDPEKFRLLVLAPHVIERREPKSHETQHLKTLEKALMGFSDLRAGSSGRLALSTSSIDGEMDPLFLSSRIWESVTPYLVTRHMKKSDAATVFSNDLGRECHRRGLPDPDITIIHLKGANRIGLIGKARISFKVAVRGPLVLGKNRHLGGGLFVGRS